MIKTVKNFIGELLDFLFPSVCFGCKKAVLGGAVICDECKNKIEYTHSTLCDKCGLNKRKCDCKKYVYHFSKITAPFYNTGIAQRGIYRLKFSQGEILTPFYAEEMLKKVKSKYAHINFSCVTFVPMSPIKRFIRGYNQAQLLAEYIAQKMEIPLKRNLLKRRFLSKTQHKSKSVGERFLNAKSSFTHKNNRQTGNILLVDDIKTVGATLDACAKALLINGAEEVFCVTAVISNKNS